MADYYGTDTVISDLRDDGLLIMRINRPDVADALNGETSRAMENIMNNAEQRTPAVRAIIVTGTGKVSLRWRGIFRKLSSKVASVRRSPSMVSVVSTARVCSKPIIAAVNGSAAGGGIAICDIVVANENAKFGCTEVGLGIIASTGGIVRLARDINRKDCMELLLTGKKIKAPEAKELGLINYAVPADEVMDKAIEIAETILQNAPLALKWTKYLVHACDQMKRRGGDALLRCCLSLP